MSWSLAVILEEGMSVASRSPAVYQSTSVRLQVDAERVVHVTRTDSEDDFAVDAQVGVRRLERDKSIADALRLGEPACLAFADVVENSRSWSSDVGVGGHDAEHQKVYRRPFRHLRPLRQPREDGRVFVDVQDVDVDLGPVA